MQITTEAKRLKRSTHYTVHSELTDGTLTEGGPPISSKKTAVQVARKLAKSPAPDTHAYVVCDADGTTVAEFKTGNSFLDGRE